MVNPGINVFFHKKTYAPLLLAVMVSSIGGIPLVCSFVQMYIFLKFHNAFVIDLAIKLIF